MRPTSVGRTNLTSRGVLKRVVSGERLGIDFEELIPSTFAAFRAGIEAMFLEDVLDPPGTINDQLPFESQWAVFRC